MSILYEIPNYTPEKLVEAKQSMTRSEAYSLVSKYYILLNYKKELENNRISFQRYSECIKEIELRTSSEFDERDGYKKHLGTELLPTSDIKYEEKLKKAFYIVDDDFRNGQGNIDFMARFASVLPKPFLNMVFVMAIHNQNESMIDAIQSNGTEAFLEFDELLKKEYPQFRLKAIHSGTVYASTLLDYAFAEINNMETFDFTRAADIYSLLDDEQRADYNLFMKIKKDCYDGIQLMCPDISQYQRNKEIFLEKVLKSNRYENTDLSEFIANAPKYYLEKSAILCPMQFAVDKFLNFFLLPEKYSGADFYRDASDEAESWADTIVDIDIEERCVAAEKRYQYQKEQPINRTAKEEAVLRYANDIVRRKIVDVESAKKYINRHKRNGESDVIAPNPVTMQMIMNEYGNDSEIKELLFADMVGLNHLWDVIPYNIIPKEYTTYEKMIAGTQILATDFSRINEIPEDIRKRIFDSKDCITRILFPGAKSYSRYEGVVGLMRLGQYSRDINPTLLLTQVLGKTSSRLKKEGYIQDVAAMYKEYIQFHSKPYDEKLDWVTMKHILDLNEVPIISRPLFGLSEVEKIDTAREFELENSINEVGDASYASKAYSIYSPNELAKAKKMLTIPESIQIIEEYYRDNKNQIIDLKSKKIIDNTSDSYLSQQAIDYSRLLGQEVSMIGRGELLRLAARNIDDMLYGRKPIDPNYFESVKSFATKYAPYLPEEFVIQFNRLLSIRGQKAIGTDFNTDKYRRIIRECRKYLLNQSFRENIDFDPKDLSDCISKTYVNGLDENDLSTNEFLYLLYTMISCYDKTDFNVEFKNYNSQSKKVVPNDIKRATDKAVKLLLDGEIKMDNTNWNTLISGHKTLSSFEFYPMHSRMIGCLMEKMYNSKCLEEEKKSSLTNQKAGDGIRKFLSSRIVSNNRRNNIFFRNISPDEFLKWDAMDEGLLERAIVIMGRNDVEVLQILDAIDEVNGNALIKQANIGMSQQEIEAFKERLIRVKKAIFSDKDRQNIVTLFEPDEDFTLLPNHKQPVNAYLYNIHKLMTQEQINDSFVKSALFNDCNSDYRVQQLTPQALEGLIKYLTSQMPTQKEKDALQKENRGATNHSRSYFEDPQ